MLLWGWSLALKRVLRESMQPSWHHHGVCVSVCCVWCVCVHASVCACVSAYSIWVYTPSFPIQSMVHTGLSSTWPPSTGGCQVIPRTQWSVSGGPSTLPLQRPRMWATLDWPAFFIAMVTFLMQWWLQGQPWTSLEAR